MQAGVTGTPTERAGGALWPRAPHTKAGHITSHKAGAVSTHEAHYIFVPKGYSKKRPVTVLRAKPSLSGTLLKLYLLGKGKHHLLKVHFKRGLYSTKRNYV